MSEAQKTGSGGKAESKPSPSARGEGGKPAAVRQERSVPKEIKILRSPTPNRQAARRPASRSRRRSLPRERTRSQVNTSTKSRRSRSPRGRRYCSRSRGRRRPQASDSRGKRRAAAGKRRRVSRSSSGSRRRHSRRSPPPAKPSVFMSTESLTEAKADSAPKGFSFSGAPEATEASAEAIRLAQLKAASSLRQNAPPPPANMRPDDWFCPVCTTHNYASRTRCFRCNQGVNPGRGGGPPASSWYGLSAPLLQQQQVPLLQPTLLQPQ